MTAAEKGTWCYMHTAERGREAAELTAEDHGCQATDATLRNSASPMGHIKASEEPSLVPV